MGFAFNKYCTVRHQVDIYHNSKKEREPVTFIIMDMYSLSYRFETFYFFLSLLLVGLLCCKTFLFLFAAIF